MPDTATRPDADLVSVIIPVRNGVPFVGEAIASALAQDHPAIEVLVVDDASTDGTATWVHTRFGDRVRVLSRRDHAGPSAARNHGIAAAQGVFLQFLDADDTLPPSKIARQIDRLRREAAQVAVATTIDAGSGAARRVRELPRSTAGRLRASFLRGSFITTHAVLCRTDLVRAAGGFREDLRRCEDYELWLRLVDTGATFVMTPEVTVEYTRRADSLSADRRAMILANWRVLTDALRRRPPHDGAERRAAWLHRASLAVRFVMASLF